MKKEFSDSEEEYITNIMNKIMSPTELKEIKLIAEYRRLCKKAYKKSYNKRPEVKARKREYHQKPEVKARKREYHNRPEVKARKREYYQKPEVKARYREYLREYYQKNRDKILAKRRSKD